MDTLLLTNIHKSFDKRILLQNVEFECKVGQIIGVLGRNGCGKSTLLKMIFGTEKADTIGIKINSKVYTPKEIIPSRRIGYLPPSHIFTKRYNGKRYYFSVFSKR